ncbi:MAG: glycosyltransferase [Patescibacteria group bacterium]
MKILYFGDYDPNYTRTRVLVKGLEENGTPVIHCNERQQGLLKYWKLWKKINNLKGQYDYLFVGFGDSRFMPVFARIVSKKPIVWEALFSQYDNWVFDRRLAKPHSLKAYLYWFTDWIGCFFSHLIILDTKLHTNYFSKTFGVPQKKLAHVYVGADTGIFFPKPRTKQSPYFEVEFHGKFFPMQGADVIVRTAKLLEKNGVHFTLIGSGQEAKKVRRLAEELSVSNVTFHGYLPQEEIVEHIANADVCVGLIGNVPRVVRAIPTKLWEAAAMAKVSINASPGSLEEVFTPNVDAIGLTAGNHEELAKKILALKESGRAEAMGQEAYKTFLKIGTPKQIGLSLIQTIKTRFSS